MEKRGACLSLLLCPGKQSGPWCSSCCLYSLLSLDLGTDLQTSPFPSFLQLKSQSSFLLSLISSGFLQDKKWRGGSTSSSSHRFKERKARWLRLRPDRLMTPPCRHSLSNLRATDVGEQPAPLTLGLFIWNMILLNPAGSGTERKNIHSGNYSDRAPAGPPSQACFFSFCSLYSPFISGPVRGPRGLCGMLSELPVLAQTLLKMYLPVLGYTLSPKCGLIQWLLEPKQNFEELYK